MKGKFWQNNIFILLILTISCIGFFANMILSQAEAAPPECIDFEDLRLGTRYFVGDTFTDSGVDITVEEFQWSDGQWTQKGYTEVQKGMLAGGSGQEMFVNNVNLDFNFGIWEGLFLRFGEYGGNLNIGINGDFRNFENFVEIHGKTIGGVNVSVVNGLGQDKGILKLSGSIKSFFVGGQELFIDDVCPLPPPSEECIDFEDPRLGTIYRVGDTFTDSGALIIVEPFQWNSGRWTSDGYTEVLNAGLAGGSGQEMFVNNVNLDFNFGIWEGLSLLFGEYGGNLNIEINGAFKNFENFIDIDGATIGGVNVSVVNGSGQDKGILRLFGNIASFAVGGQELFIDDVCPLPPCYPDLPNPELCVTGTEDYEVDGQELTRYNLTVINWSAFPDELFEPAPDLPPCGLNPNASRTWVDIFDENDNRIYGFCNLSSSEGLTHIWFGIPKDETPPDFVYITLTDRRCDIEYTSNLASTAVNYQIRSVWASEPPSINGVVDPGEWDAADSEGAVISLCYGYMLVQNDDENLYILVDLTEDIHDDPPLNNTPWGDFFWLTFDVNSDEMIVSGEDVQYATIPGSYELGLQYYLGPGVWTGLNETASLFGAGFGPSLYSNANHRLWEFAISLEEIQTSITDWLEDPGMVKPIRSGLRTYSQEPTFDVYHPSYFPTNFSNLIEILPALGSPLPSGDYIFRGVGAIPVTEIDEYGYATTVPDYHPYVVDAPFGSFLRIFGNLDFLRSEGVKYYKVLYQQIDDISPPAPLKESWVNYLWEEVDSTYEWVPYTITYKDAAGQEDVYEIPPAAEDWYFDKLLIGWSSWRFPDGRYSLSLEAFDNLGNPVPLPAELNELILTLDNTRPHVEITQIAHGEEVVGRCDIIYLDADDLTDGLRFTVTAWDDKIGENYIPKHLYRYSLIAHYGQDESVTIDNDADNYYSAHVDEHGPNLWGGVQDLVIPAEAEAPWRPPESCAYQFRLSVRSRTTNGYSRRIHYNEYNEHVTILLGEPGMCNPGDVSGDGNVTTYDAALIMQFVVGLINELPVSAAQSPTDNPQSNYAVTIPELTALAGDKIQVPIAINDTKGLNAGGLVVKYDPSILRAVDFTASSLLNNAYWKANIERIGEVRFAFATAEPTQGKGTLLMVEFEVLPNTTGKTSVLALDTVNLINSLTVTKINGSVNVLPKYTDLLPNFPNPFNPDTWIPYQLSQDAKVVMRIYNQKGQIVRTIALEQQPAGSYVTKDRAVYWDGTNNFGEHVASGTYFYTLQAGKFTATRRMLIIK